jgi:hypothetical protein
VPPVPRIAKSEYRQRPRRHFGGSDGDSYDDCSEPYRDRVPSSIALKAFLGRGAKFLSCGTGFVLSPIV